MTSGTSTEALLTKEQVCVYLNISSPTLERWLKQKKIPAIRIGRTVRFSLADLEALVNPSTSLKTQKP